MYNPEPHMTNWQTFAIRLPLITALLCLTAGLSIYTTGSSQTAKLAERESQRLGQALAAQLAETIRQPLLHNDLVSLQVSVEQLVKRAEVAGASVYNAKQKQLARSTSKHAHRSSDLVTYREPLTVEGTVTAYAGVDIDSAHLLATYRTALYWALSIWAGFTVLLTALAALMGRNLSTRLAAMIARLPGNGTHNETTHATNELSQLEQQLEPLLTQNNRADTSAKPTHQIATLALHCKNLERLEAQLSKENLQRLLNQLDIDLEQVTTLYNGQRLPGHHQTLFIEFSGPMNTGDHALQALFSAHLLMKLAALHAHSLGVGLKLSAAVSLRDSEANTSLLGDFEREKRESEAARLARLGTSEEILLDHQTQLHASLVDTINAEEMSENSEIYRVESFAAKHASLLEKQLHYLTHAKLNG